jgi:AraC family L-rhamnose operon regulatory protein RhaS
MILDVGVRRPHQTWHWPEWIVLTKEDLSELTFKLRNNEKPIWKATAAIIQSFRELARTIEAWNQPRSISRMATCLNQLLLGMLDALSEQQAQENPHLTSRRQAVELFLREIEANPVLCSDVWTIERMAAHCGLGVTAFSKYCRELVNAGPMEFLNGCRLDRAARELREKRNVSITNIALACGFNSSQYFARRFRQRFHMSPSRFAAKPVVLNGH